MAVTALNRRALLSLFAACCAAGAKDQRDVRATIVYVSSALANGNPSDALSFFLKECPGYSTLADYFSAITGGYDIASQVEITDETTEKGRSEVEAMWNLSLTSKAGGVIDRRGENVKILLNDTGSPGKPDWKIARFDPIALFNPQKV